MVGDGQFNIIYSGNVVDLYNMNNCGLGAVWTYRILMIQIDIGYCSISYDYTIYYIYYNDNAYLYT